MLKIIGSIGDVAEGQAGMVTERQAAAVGGTAAVLQELLDSRVIEPVVPGVVRLRGGARPAFPRLYAQWLLLAPDRPAWDRELPTAGVVSHTAAIRVYGVGNLPGPAAEFTVPPEHIGAPNEGVRWHRAGLEPDEYREVSGLPVTTPGRTLADLAADGSTDLEGLGRIATNFLVRGLATRVELARALERAAQPNSELGNGAEQLSALLESVDGAESAVPPEGRTDG
jgi:hypothetical protein